MKRVLIALANNVIVNQLSISLGLDQRVANRLKNWSNAKVDPAKSLQENVGFSHKPQIEAAIERVHQRIQKVFTDHCSGGPILDVGCGVGLYLSDFEPGAELFGVDLSRGFIERARDRLPGGSFQTGNYLDIQFPKQFGFIYSVGVLQYVPPSQIDRFIAKLESDLRPGGVFLLQYPHALSWLDCHFSDLSCVQYSPRYIEDRVRKRFKILAHMHAFDERPLDFAYDKTRYDPDMKRSFRNGAILVAQKR